jgi:hypothetical protein
MLFPVRSYLPNKPPTRLYITHSQNSNIPLGDFLQHHARGIVIIKLLGQLSGATADEEVLLLAVCS